MTKSKKIDWEAIEREYRAGQLSIREIARQHSISAPAITKKAKIKGWSRDLSERVRKAIKAKLVNDSVSTCNVDDVVEAAATRGVEVISLHRRDIAKLRALENSLLAELSNKPTKTYAAQFQGQVITKEINIAVTERSSACQALAAVQHKRIQLERQAYNLDDRDDKDDLKTKSTEDLESEARLLAEQILASQS